MSTPIVISDTRNRARKVESLRFISKVGGFVYEEDEENAQINQDCTARFEKFQASIVKQELENHVATEADVDARRKQLFEQFEKERQLIIGQVQPEKMIRASYHNFAEVLCSGSLNSSKREQEHVDMSNDNRTKELSNVLPIVDKGNDPQFEAEMAYEDKSEEGQCEGKDHCVIPAQDSENRLTLLSQYLPFALEDRGSSTELELDRLSRQVQVLVHQLAGCRQNLLRAEVEVNNSFDDQSPRKSKEKSETNIITELRQVPCTQPLARSDTISCREQVESFQRT